MSFPVQQMRSVAVRCGEPAKILPYLDPNGEPVKILPYLDPDGQPNHLLPFLDPNG